MKAHIVLACLLLTAFPSFSQSLVHHWTHAWGNADVATVPDLAVDEDGNVYAAGSFKGTIDFEPGNGSTTFTSGQGGDASDTYISKFGPTGQFLWTKHIVSTGQHVASKIVYDTSGYIYITGYFSGTSDFDPGTETFILSATGQSDEMFLLKLDLDGNFIWAISTQGGGDAHVGSIALDSDGNILAGGTFTGTVDFDPSPADSSYTAISQMQDVFFAKYSDAGTLVWSEVIFGSHRIRVTGVDTDDSGNAYYVGVFDDQRDFDNGPDSLILQAFGEWDVWVLKLNSSGHYQWVRRLGNDGENIATDVAVDGNNVFVSGIFNEEIDFDQGTQIYILTATDTDPFIWNMDLNGEFKWAGQFAGISYDSASAITVDDRGDLYVSGYFSETVDFDPGPGSYLLTSTGNNGNEDAFVVKLHPNGQLVWAEHGGGLQDDMAGSVELDSRSNVYATGGFRGKAGFFLGETNEDSLVSAGSIDVFLTRWTQCLETYGNLEIVTCNEPFTSPSGNYIWTETGIYQDTIDNSAGCDSVLTINLEVVILNPAVDILPEGGLSAVEVEGTYQWVICAKELIPIPGETNQDFFPVESGLYAVIILHQGCKATSDCFFVSVVSVEESQIMEKVILYPNPTNQGFTLQLPSQIMDVDVKLSTITGQVIIEKYFKNMNAITIDDPVQPGLYFVQVNVGSARKVFKLIVH